MKESVILKNIAEKFNIQSLNDMQKAMSESYNKQRIILLSPTGSGKTIAFTIPLIKNLNQPNSKIQAVVIAPSRELAVQINNVIQKLAVGFKVTCCYGGHNFTDEENSLSAIPDIVVATPGRLLDHSNRGNVDLRSVRILILDEFDKSLELGFQDEMRKLSNRMQNVSRLILTSATDIDEFPKFIKIDDAVTLNFLKVNATEERLKVYRTVSDQKDKLESLFNLLSNLDNGKTIIFSNYRESAERIFEFLKQKNLPVGIYHGGLDQIEREKAISMFNNGTFMILTTTDLGSRGLDIDNVSHIIHYHLPQTPETYKHRNGRSARVNATGCIYVITSPNEILPDFIKCDSELKLIPDAEIKLKKEYETLFFSAGKKEKISRGDILGFLASKGGVEAKEIGKINVSDHYSLAAVPYTKVKDILQNISHEKIKNKRVRITIARQ